MNPLNNIFTPDGIAATEGLAKALGLTPIVFPDAGMLFREDQFDGVQMRAIGEDGRLYAVTIRVEGVR